MCVCAIAIAVVIVVVAVFRISEFHLITITAAAALRRACAKQTCIQKPNYNTITAQPCKTFAFESVTHSESKQQQQQVYLAVVL